MAATDGSVVDDPDEGMCMGAGIAFREGGHALQDTLLRVSGHVTTFVAEGAAASFLLGMVPADVPLTILTDSANIMFTMQHCSRLEKWRDFSNHPDEALVKELALRQASRTARTHWVKIKSHTSVLLNKQADELAMAAPDSEDAWSKRYTEQTDDNVIQFHRLDGNAEANATLQSVSDYLLGTRAEHVTSNATRTVRKMCAPGTGRRHFSHALWRTHLEAKVVKHMLQCLTNTFPTQKRLWIMKKVDSPKCRYCNADKEDNLYHWQQECTGFHDARTKVHNDIWAAVFSALRDHLPGGWKAFTETTVRDLPTIQASSIDARFANRRPDGVFLRKDTVTYVMVDLVRGYGFSRQDLQDHETRKRGIYANLLQALQQHHTVQFFPLACTYNGAIAEDTWRAFMTTLGLDNKAQLNVLRMAAKAICLGFSAMVDIRHGSLFSNHVGDRRC